MESDLDVSCIYCTKSRPFTDEHVFPAGMGGDDRYVLKGLVCQICNTDVFSALEAHLMRSSPVAIARLQLQPTGRSRGSKSKPPQLEHDQCVLIDHLGQITEAQLLAGGHPLVLPQLRILENEFHMSADSEEALISFITDVDQLLDTSVRILSKDEASNVRAFAVTDHVWDGQDYWPSEPFKLDTPPHGIWLEPLRADGGWPRMHKRYRGGIVLRVAAAAQAAPFLSKLKRNLSDIVAKPVPQPNSIDRPLMHVGMKTEPRKTVRAIAKIGVNFAILEYGEKVVRSPAFGPIRDLILKGSDNLRQAGMEQVQNMFAKDMRPVHIAMLFPIKTESAYTLAFIFRLYGGEVHMFLLADGLIFERNCEPVVFIVHYLEKKMERVSMNEYAHFLVHGSRIWSQN